MAIRIFPLSRMLPSPNSEVILDFRQIRDSQYSRPAPHSSATLVLQQHSGRRWARIRHRCDADGMVHGVGGAASFLRYGSPFSISSSRSAPAPDAVLRGVSG